MLCGNDKVKINYEHNPILETDNIGREKFWEDLGRKDD